MRKRTILVAGLVRRGAPLGVTAAAVATGCAPQGMLETPGADALERLTIRDSLYREISYLRGGEPGLPRVVFVHGTPGSATNMARYIRDPIEGHEVISIDRPGFGATGGAPVPSFEKQAAAIEPFLVTRDGQKPVLVGHSLGGPIVARAAADYPAPAIVGVPHHADAPAAARIPSSTIMACAPIR